MKIIIIIFLWISICMSSYSQERYRTDMRKDTIVNIEKKKVKKIKKDKNEKKSFASNDTIVKDSVVAVPEIDEQELLNDRKIKAINKLQTFETAEYFYLISFVDSLLNANLIVSYFDKIKRLQQLYKDISVLHINNLKKIDYLGTFVKGVETVKRANDVLNRPYNREIVKQIKDEISTFGEKLQSKLQAEECDSIERCLSLYFLATSNMISIIDEIEPLKDTLQIEQCDSLIHSAFDFENRNKTIERIGYMKQLYVKLRKAFPKNGDGQYDIHFICWGEIESIKQELIECRKTK